MRRHIYKAIKEEWGKISTSEQRYLIFQYLEGDGRDKLHGSWMEFLQEYFEVPSTPPIKAYRKGKEAVC